ncbi:MAG TPA: oxygen-independent coproporphyrinogen III oxidase [Gemmatimonadales bacterium]|jgi:oxygen-independent coproporphyrinogen-3 oxidase|nr:oxygen-independent coproporphyrinogen III oxidase [Gemmatimonadales bacterium]
MASGVGGDTVPAMTAPLEARPDVWADVLAKYDRRAPRYTSYPPIPAWSAAVGPSAYSDALAVAGADPAATFSLYLHLPFCPRRCLYCGCNVVITRRRGALEAYLDRLEKEVDLVTQIVGRRRRVTQLHLGGGTPNYLDDAELERLWRILDLQFDLTAARDTSIEADPRLGAAEQFARLHALGFRRVSFGVQDLEPRVQQAIGRVQPLDLVRHAIESAHSVGFGGVSLDLIYGLPEQTLESFGRTLDAIVELAPDRVACFGYAHLPTMYPHERALERYHLPDASERFALQRLAAEHLTRAGYTWIGLDHFAIPQDDLSLAARHGRLHRNFNGYTTMPADHLLGFGMSAIGEVAGTLVQNDADLAGWHARIHGGELATVRGHRLTEGDRRRRAAIQSLMCNLELPLALIEDLGAGLTSLLTFADDGLVERRGDRVVVTPTGRFFLRTLCTAFDAYLPMASDARPISLAI